MDVKEAIQKRRAYRSLAPFEISEALIKELAISAQLAPSCFNNQPWKFVFVYDKDMLIKIREALSSGNVWAHAASLIIVAFGKKEDDCDIKGREYYLFDIGMACAFIQLRATELDLVAHPIAGFSEEKVKEILGIPEEMKVITLINVGKKSDTISEVLSEKQVELEEERPERKSHAEFVYRNRYA
ncbi:MAG: nitroreductase family protein [Thermoplasmata archaeon]|nr:MAG: nitroreductase family protein [Thermoplasmata archaeon]